MGVYASFISLAKNLIATKGGPAIYMAVGRSPSVYPVTAVRTQYPVDRAQNITTVRLNYEKGDELVYVAASELPIDPIEQVDYITAGGADWQVVSSTLISPNGERILFEFHVRRWPTRL